MTSRFRLSPMAFLSGVIDMTLNIGPKQNLVKIASFGQQSLIHGHVEPREGYGNVSPWSVDIAECDYHVCSMNKMGEVFDRFNGVYSYVCKARSRDEAFSRWKGFVLGIGVHAENAVMLDG